MFSPQTRWRWLLGVTVPTVTALVACDAPTTPRAIGPSIKALVVGPSITTSLGGFAVLDNNGAELALVAVRYADGTVTGFASGVNPGSLSGPIVELVPPHGTIDFWCANEAVTNVPALQGFNFIWYIRDIGNGKKTFDEVGTAGDFNTSCSAQPGPPTSSETPFQPVVQGDFRGSVK